MSNCCNCTSSLNNGNSAVNGKTTNGSLPDDNLPCADVVNNKDNAFGATVIRSRAVNYLLTKLRCKETSGRVSACTVSLLIVVCN